MDLSIDRIAIRSYSSAFIVDDISIEEGLPFTLCSVSSGTKESIHDFSAQFIVFLEQPLAFSRQFAISLQHEFIELVVDKFFSGFTWYFFGCQSPLLVVGISKHILIRPLLVLRHSIEESLLVSLRL